MPDTRPARQCLRSAPPESCIHVRSSAAMIAFDSVRFRCLHHHRWAPPNSSRENRPGGAAPRSGALCHRLPPIRAERGIGGRPAERGALGASEAGGGRPTMRRPGSRTRDVRPLAVKRSDRPANRGRWASPRHRLLSGRRRFVCDNRHGPHPTSVVSGTGASQAGTELGATPGAASQSQAIVGLVFLPARLVGHVPTLRRLRNDCGGSRRERKEKEQVT